MINSVHLRSQIQINLRKHNTSKQPLCIYKRGWRCVNVFQAASHVQLTPIKLWIHIIAYYQGGGWPDRQAFTGQKVLVGFCPCTTGAPDVEFITWLSLGCFIFRGFFYDLRALLPVTHEEKDAVRWCDKAGIWHSNTYIMIPLFHYSNKFIIVYCTL